MNKTTSYRGINYIITKGPSLERQTFRLRVGWDPSAGPTVWHGIVMFLDGEARFERRLKGDAVYKAIHDAINIKLDYDDDDNLFRIVENLAFSIINNHSNSELPPTPRELAATRTRLTHW